MDLTPSCDKAKPCQVSLEFCTSRGTHVVLSLCYELPLVFGDSEPEHFIFRAQSQRFVSTGSRRFRPPQPLILFRNVSAQHNRPNVTSIRWRQQDHTVLGRSVCAPAVRSSALKGERAVAAPLHRILFSALVCFLCSETRRASNVRVPLVLAGSLIIPH